MRRRTFLLGAAAASLPRVEAVAAGDVRPGEALIWARAGGAGPMTVSWATSENGPRRKVQGPVCGLGTDYTGRVVLNGLPSGQRIHYEVSVAGGPATSGSFQSAPGADRAVRFLWSGDTAGQGWGINPEWGGYRIYETMRRRRPDFFIHSGDTIYADNVILPEVKLADGKVWKNLTTPEKSKVAETLDEFRGNYRYNLLDEHLRAFQSEVAQVWQWDDHEVMNNWSPSTDLSADVRYREKDIRVIAGRARQAFLEYAPIRSGSPIYRRISYGPLVEVFVLDMRSYRGPNTWNRQVQESAETAFLGRQQSEWLMTGLAESGAVWKVVASDMPIGLLVGDGKDTQGRDRFEAIANGPGEALGRELEMARVLAHLKRQNVRNVVWLTADVHYTAAHRYHPDRARFKDFLPFWEFVSGPLNAGTFGPNAADETFGMEVVYQKAPTAGQANLPPSAGMQFFGEVEVDPRSREMTVTLRDLAGDGLFTQVLATR